MRSKSFSRSEPVVKIATILVLSFAALILLGTSAGWAIPGKATTLLNGNPTPTPLGNGSGGTDLKTFWSLTKLGGGISIAIFGVFALGIFLISMQLYELAMDKVKGRVLLSVNYRQLSLGEVNKLVMRHPNSLTARLYATLLSVFHNTGNTTEFHTEIANYIEMQHDRFDTFKSRLGFLSDTAGALGLLGTVWGMFTTFFGGNLDSQRILNGMGLALVTTLIGLVVSIILNFFSTEVFSMFNKRLELISSKADEFRLWLMAIVHQRNKRKTETGGSGGQTPGKSDVPRTDAAPQPSLSTLKMRPLSEMQQESLIGQPLAEPIAVCVETRDGQRVAGVPIRFVITEGDGKLENNRRTALVRTDRHGLATIRWTMGEKVAPQKLAASIPNNERSALEFVSLPRPVVSALNEPVSTAPSTGTNRGAMA